MQARDKLISLEYEMIASRKGLHGLYEKGENEIYRVIIIVPCSLELYKCPTRED